MSSNAALAQRLPLRELVRHDEMADLSAVSLSVSPAYPVPGEATQIRLEIRTRGLKAETVEVAFFAGRHMLTTQSLTVAKPIETISIPWTPSAAGQQVISAIVDPDGRLTERDRSDNTITLELTVAERAPVGAEFSIESIGIVTGAERPGMLRIVTSNDGTVRGSAPLVVHRAGVQVAVVLAGPIEPGSRVTTDVLVSEPDLGRIRAEINPRFGRFEQQSANNVREFDRAPAIDLRIADVSLQTAHLERGQRRRVVVTFRIINAGREPITRSFRTSIEPGITDPDGIAHPFFVTTRAMPARGVVHVSHMIESAPADFTALVKTDVDNAIAESDESNNQTTLHFANPVPDIDRWVSIGPSNITDTDGYGWKNASGRLSSIAIDPNTPTTMFVGSQLGGVWKTTDGGVNWQPLADSATVRVAALALAPDNASRVFLVTPNDGVFRSDDGGTSWFQISTMNLQAIDHNGVLLIHPSRTNTLLVASEIGVFRSADGGATWQRTLGGGEATGLISLPANPDVVFAAISTKATSETEAAGIYESFDDGATWRIVTGCPGGALPTDDANTIIRLAASGRQLFASYRLNEPRKFRLLRTTNIGCSIGGVSESSWETGWAPTGTIDDDLIANTLFSGLWSHPAAPHILYLGGMYLWRSTDRGGSFSRISGLSGSGAAHMDHHTLIADPQSPNVVYSVNDGGIYRSESGGSIGTWQFIGSGISNVEFYDLVAAPLNDKVVIGGTQDNGTLKVEAGSSTIWKQINGDDGATVDIDFVNPSVFYAMDQYAGSIKRSSDGGESFESAAAGLPPAECGNLHYQVHPRKPKILLASCRDLWRSVNSGSSWTSLFTPPVGSGPIYRTAIDGPADIYYAGSKTGVIFEGPSGAGFRAVFVSPVATTITDIEIDADDRRTLYVSLGGGQAWRIARLIKTAESPATFAARDITFDLPLGRIVKTIGIDRNHRFTLFAGTDRGVFRGRSADGGSTWFWLPYSNGLPATVDVRDLEVHPATGVMRAATHGRSAFEVNTDHPVGSILVAEGRVTFLRTHDVGTGFGPALEILDAEVVVQLDSQPGKSFGFQLRADANEHERRGMLDLLRNAFRRNEAIRIEYVRTSIHNGVIARVAKIH